MRNLTVRFSLMSALALFSCMIVVGAGVGIFALGRANHATEYVHEITERALLINDAYKDTTRTRAAHGRMYATLMEKGDQAVIDGAIVNGSAGAVGWIAGRVRQIQSGFLYSYAFWMIVGLVLILGWLLVRV